MNNYDRRLEKLESRRPGGGATPRLVVVGVCPKEGQTFARWLDGSTLERADGETESAFKERVAARSALVFGDPWYEAAA